MQAGPRPLGVPIDDGRAYHDLPYTLPPPYPADAVTGAVPTIAAAAVLWTALAVLLLRNVRRLRRGGLLAYCAVRAERLRSAVCNSCSFSSRTPTCPAGLSRSRRRRRRPQRRGPGWRQQRLKRWQTLRPSARPGPAMSPPYTAPALPAVSAAPTSMLCAPPPAICCDRGHNPRPLRTLQRILKSWSGMRQPHPSRVQANSAGGVGCRAVVCSAGSGSGVRYAAERNRSTQSCVTIASAKRV